MDPKSLILLIAPLIVFLVGATQTPHYDQIETTIDNGCQSECGGVQIPYPFGIGISSKTSQNCFLQKKFNLSCTNSTLTMSNSKVPIIAINITQGQLDMMILVSKVCYNRRLSAQGTRSTTHMLTSKAFPISSKDNKFISVGCDTYGYLTTTFDGSTYSTGCLTRCYNNSTKIVDGKCSGIGCCQVDIPNWMRILNTSAFSFENFNSSLNYNNCSYSFVVKNGSYTFSKDHLENLGATRMPVVFDWSIGNETCKDSESRGTNACKGNSTCVDSDTDKGYRCKCKDGYQGNPYHPNGCTDIDECKTQIHTCMSDYNCLNTVGSYKCFCPKGKSGNGTMQDKCRHQNALYKYVLSASSGLITLFVAISLLFMMYQKRKLIKLKEKFFKQNGGLILQNKLESTQQSSQTAQIFTSEELKKATNNYDESLIIGKGGFGTVFKGTLEDKRIVAIKKSIIVDKTQIEQFINEVVVLSQINHRNIVKLLGCCLETEVPSLVYEFVNNGTLFDLIQDRTNTKNLTWGNRLRIAAESAGALSYLHFGTSIPIIHRDVKSANILLDENFTAKVSDFGASRLVPIEQTAIATMVQGTFGYLDPEYMQTSELTEKSDVYSFGVVLIELLTGEKPLSEEKRSLATYFLSCLKENRLVDVLEIGIWNDENKKEIEEVAVLAARCLRLKGDERPSMKEVAMELEGIRRMQKQSWINDSKQNYLEEMDYLLPKSLSKVYENGDSSSNQNMGYYDSIKDQVLIAFDDGR